MKVLPIQRDLEPLLSTREVAELLGKSQNRVREMPLPWMRIGGRWKLEPKDLRAYLDERKEGAA